MKQVLQNLKNGEISVLDVPPPALRLGGALVATHASVISAGTERSKLELGEKSLLGKARARPELAQKVVQTVREDGLRETYKTVMLRLDTPSALGYSACGEVIAVAPDCAGVEPGDLVACAGQDHAHHAEVNFVPKHLLARVPSGVRPEHAAYATLGAIAMQGVRQAEAGLGERIAVIGLGLVGLLTVQVARAAGARVLGIDLDEERCALAARTGAERVALPSDPLKAIVDAFTDGMGVDAVILCAATPSSEPIKLAAELCRDRGRIVVLGAVGMNIPREPYYRKELELRLSRAYGPGSYDPAYEQHGHEYPVGYVRWTEQRHLAEFLRLLDTGLVNVEELTTHRFPVDEAEHAYALIAGKAHEDRHPIGVLLEYPNAREASARLRVETTAHPRRASRRRQVQVALIGAGNFATRVLLPAITADGRAQLVGVATASGVSARQVAERFRFTYATSDAEALIDDPGIDAVVVATRHDSHAALTARAMRAGKAVFCEKPLATTWEGLEDVARAYAESPVPLLVGFNRRFSPFSRALREALPSQVTRAVMCRVNAGELPADHWSKDPVAGGGRIVGELCHFLDLACFFAEDVPVRVSAETLASPEPIELRESIVVHVAFGCGSVASIQYLANGDPRVARERVEVFSGGTVGVIDDFRRLEVVGKARGIRRRARRQEKGHREEMRTFFDLATGDIEDPSASSAAFWSSSLTLRVPEALSLGRSVAINLPEALVGLSAQASRKRRVDRR